VKTLVVRSIGLPANPKAGVRSARFAAVSGVNLASVRPAAPTRSAPSDAVPPEKDRKQARSRF
jgi:hypothetical protein